MSNKPKVLFVGPLPPPFSGPELSMKQFLDSKILRHNYDISFLKTNFRKDNTKKGKLDLAMFSNFFSYFFSLIKLLVRNRPQCVYYPITPTQIGWLGRDVWTILISKLFGVKVIIHLRGSHFKLNFKSFHTISKLLIGFALKKVDRAIVQANYLDTEFSPYLSGEQTSVLYQSMDTKEFNLSKEEEVVENSILVVGHMTKAKGYNDILKILPEIADAVPDVIFKFAGNIRKGERGVFYNQITGEKITYEDPFLAEAQILKSKYKKNYQNLGLISGSKKLEHFNATDVFVSASYSEGFSRSLLEAMAVGKPIVYTPVGAHREVYNDQHGIAFCPGDLKGLKSAILSMLDTDSRRVIGESNRDYVMKNFTVSKICTDFSNIINLTIQ